MSCTGLSLFILLESKRISDTPPSSTCCVFCVRVFVFFFSAIRQQEGNGPWDLFVSRVLRGHSPPRDFYLGLLTKQVLKFSPVYFLKMWRWAWMDGWRRGGGSMGSVTDQQEKDSRGGGSLKIDIKQCWSLHSAHGENTQNALVTSLAWVPKQ